MGNVHTFTSHVRSRYGILDASIDAATLETVEYVDMRNYDLVVFEALASAVISASALTLKIYQATSTAGAASVSMTHALASAVSTATHATHCHLLQAQVRGEDLTAGYRYVGAQLSANASVPAPCAIVIHQMRGRYKQATLPA
jgi:hypothetical protein